VTRRNDPPDEEERRRVFRRMAWTFVYLPPLLVVAFAVFGGAITALMIPFPYVGYGLRLLFWAVVLIVLGVGAYVIQRSGER
jgi:hypothetical protein